MNAAFARRKSGVQIPPGPRDPTNLISSAFAILHHAHVLSAYIRTLCLLFLHGTSTLFMLKQCPVLQLTIADDLYGYSVAKIRRSEPNERRKLFYETLKRLEKGKG